jgi:TRAP transporter TAXI family solute receptor
MSAETKPSERTVLRMSGTTARDLRGALARLDDVDVKVVTEGGSSVTGLQNLQQGRIDVAMAMADVTYLAYAGQLESTSPPFDQLRGLAVVTLNTVHLLAAKGVNVTSIGDLKGLRVALGPAGSATALLAARTLEAYGIHLTDVQSHQLSYVETADKLAKGEMDAAFMTQIPPSQPIVTATDAGATLVDIDGPVIELLRTRYQYLKRTMIPRATYPNQREPVRTIGVDLLLTCRAAVDEDVVYRLLEEYFAMRPGTLLPADVERAPATPIPLHAGAARYYRQRELTR